MPSKNSSLGVQRNCCERSESFGENWRIIMESDYIEISKLSMNERYSTVFVSQWICLHFLRYHDSRNCWRGVFANGIDWHLVWIYLSKISWSESFGLCYNHVQVWGIWLLQTFCFCSITFCFCFWQCQTL